MMRYITYNTADKMLVGLLHVLRVDESTNAKAMEWLQKFSTTDPVYKIFLDSWVWAI
jgi:hypothetical protein